MPICPGSWDYGGHLRGHNLRANHLANRKPKWREDIPIPPSSVRPRLLHFRTTEGLFCHFVRHCIGQATLCKLQVGQMTAASKRGIWALGLGELMRERVRAWVRVREKGDYRKRRVA